VLSIFVSVRVDLEDERGGSRSMLLSEPSNLSSWEEADPMHGLEVPILNGDDEVGGPVIVVMDKPIGGLPGLWYLEAFMLELSLQLSDSCISYLSLLASLTLRLLDSGNKALHDTHDSFGVLLVNGEDGGGGAGRDWWCRGGRSEGSRGVGTGLIGCGNGVV
jgi:hypothetical protein